MLDEANRMLDMRFKHQIIKTLLEIKPDRQSVMTSTTWPENARRLNRHYRVDMVNVLCPQNW